MEINVTTEELIEMQELLFPKLERPDDITEEDWKIRKVEIAGKRIRADFEMYMFLRKKMVSAKITVERTSSGLMDIKTKQHDPNEPVLEIPEEYITTEKNVYV